MKRCTRKDGTVGLASVCSVCHREAERAGRQPTRRSARVVQLLKRSRAADNAAKLARLECECDDKCHRAVTADDLGLFEWDHLVQSFDAPDYKAVGALVCSHYSVERCDKERAKCRLLYFQCHREHSGKQIRVRSVQLG